MGPNKIYLRIKNYCGCYLSSFSFILGYIYILNGIKTFLKKIIPSFFPILLIATQKLYFVHVIYGINFLVPGPNLDR